MSRDLLTINKEELAEKKEFLLELSTRLQLNISKGSRELKKTMKIMNKVVAEIEQLEKEIKEIKELIEFEVTTGGN